MVSEIAIETKLDIPYALLWRARSSPSFMRFLVKNGVLNRMDATPEEKVSDTVRTRKQIYVPKTIDIPAMVKPLFDDTYLEITDTHEWDEKMPFEMKFSITPGVLQEYITMGGILRMKPCDVEGDNACIQTIQASCQVDIPFVGWYVEQAIIANMQTFYEAYPEHIKAFADMLGTRYGDGTVKSLNAAFERMIMEEENEAKHALNGMNGMNGLNGISGHMDNVPIVNSISGNNNSKRNSECNTPLPDPSSVGDTTEKTASAESAK